MTGHKSTMRIKSYHFPSPKAGEDIDTAIGSKRINNNLKLKYNERSAA